MTAPNTTNPPTTPKSTFVTVVAWIFIVLSGFSTVISLLQNVMVGIMPRDLLDSTMQDTTFAQMIPSSARFMFANFQFIVVGFFILCVITLLSSIGLLRRRNWA